MTFNILEHEAEVRLGLFFGLLLAMMLWELAAPRRQVPARRGQRWVSHLGIQLVNGAVLRLLFPGAAVGVALWLEQRGIGLLQQWDWHWGLELLIGLLLLDLAIYAQHVAVHHVPWLWRLHRMHHSDTVFDTTTALRFHPLEILLSMGWKCAVLALLGPPVLAVLLFELILNGTALFNHANIRLPGDRYLRWLVVTPDMHRVHHSTVPRETNSTFGFNLPWWDHLFGTYRAQPAAGHVCVQIGLSQFRDAAEGRLDRLLLQPFR